MALHPDIRRLANLLGRLETLMADNDAAYWSATIGVCRRALENSDAWGLERFRSLFGGMGSLNDLILHKDQQPLVRENEELSRLLREAYTLADELARG